MGDKTKFMKTIKEVMDISVADFDFSVRCTNCMNRMGIKTLADLTKHSQEEIAKMRNMGRKSLEEINIKLAEMGLTYHMDNKAWLQWGLRHIELIKAL